MPNRLASQSSPYLRQHADNPVDWYPWGDEAFEKARAESKPIFLSVGYSTCHWCHVMAHESFENEAIAKVLNDNFVPIKVDREERPDVDRVYMLFVQATTGSGGWPMSVWLTPELEPFYGGTYFPSVAQWGRPGFVDVLHEISRVWRSEPEKVRQSAAQVTRQITRLADARGGGSRSLGGEDADRMLDDAVSEFARAFDGTHGGFGGAPKFPRPSELLFLLREAARLPSDGAAAGKHRDADAGAREMVVRTLHAMAAGGIHDHVGGGFHRYSVDARWHVPHFEKMLYDQAQLVLAYLEAFQSTGDEGFARVAASTLEYVARDLTRPGGGFYSAEDADSVPPEQAGDPRAHGSEGAFYVWTAEEVKQLLGEDAALACARFGIREHGNVESDPHGELAGKNVLCLARTLEELTGSSRQAGSVAARLDDVRRRLFAARAKRPRPGLDDKVIVAWNGLMVAAFARAARVLAHREAHAEASADWLRHAQQAASFIRATMWQPGRGVLLRRFRDGHAGIEGYAEDFACLVFGLLELFQADGNPDWLEWASELQRRQDELFWDERGGGWFNTTGNDASVLLRIKEDYDGAEPAASSVSLFNALTLARLTGPSDVHARIARTFESFAGQLRGTPRAVPMMLAALSVWRSSPQEIAIVGSAGSQDTKALLAAVAFSYLPAAVVVPVDPGCQAALSRLLPFVESMTMLDGRATAYVCRDFACNRPTTEPYEVQEHIRRTAVE